MVRCPKCSYILVLLPKRNKYKCAKCGGSFPQKEIDDREFREWNKRQRESDKETLRSKRKKLTEEERKQRVKEWRQNNS